MGGKSFGVFRVESSAGCRCYALTPVWVFQSLSSPNHICWLKRLLAAHRRDRGIRSPRYTFENEPIQQATPTKNSFPRNQRSSQAASETAEE